MPPPAQDPTHHPAIAQLRREIPRIIPIGVLGGTPTTERKRIQLRSLLLLLSRTLMVLLR